MEVAATVAAAVGVVEVTSQLANVSINAVGSTRDLLVKQFGNIEVSRELVEKSRLVLKNLALETFHFKEIIDSLNGITHERGMKIGAKIAAWLSFHGENEEAEKAEFLGRVEDMLDTDQGTIKVMQVKYDIPDEKTNTITANFGFMVALRRADKKYDIEYAVHKSILSASSEQDMVKTEKKTLFGISIGTITTVEKAPFQFSIEDVNILTQGLLRLKAMEHFKSCQLVEGIKMIDDVKCEASAPA
eukprot:GEMP01042347.1.p1 GENE.GEMP01042347.1~~GEMP01042347.1.p1  ORF type:complete len:278 (+),score=24.24 GEMP01042347.1:100-834(+)